MTRYEEWIATYVASHDVHHGCYTATEKMVAVFLELRKVRGFIKYQTLLPALGGESFAMTQQHWWCETEGGTVVDPTVSQFDFVPDGYEEFDPEIHGPEPVGKCRDCGAYVYEDDNYEGFCNERCFRATMTYLNSGLL